MGQCGPVCHTECQVCRTKDTRHEVVAEAFGDRLVPLALSTEVASILFTRVEFANGNEKAVLNLNEFSIKGLSMTGTFSMGGGGDRECGGGVMDNRPGRYELGPGALLGLGGTARGALAGTYDRG